MVELDPRGQEQLRARAAAWLDAEVPGATAAGQALAATVRRSLRRALRRCGAVRLRLLESGFSAPPERLEALLLEISGALGFALPQTRTEQRVVRIQDEGSDYARHTTRGHQTNATLAFHSDRCDLNLLLYVQVAARGGELSVASYEDAASRLRERDARAHRALFEGYPFDLREERIFPSLAWHWRPILWRRGGAIRGHYIRRFIGDSQRHEDCPRLSAPQLEALDQFDRVLDDLRGPNSFAPQAGDLVLLDNYRVMHARTGFTDSGGSSARRLALRTWVAPFDSEELPLALHPLTGSCAAGSYRGGVGSGPEFLKRLGALAPHNPAEA